MRYPSFRWRASLLALMMAVGLCAESALRAQVRSAPTTPARNWWNASSPTSSPQPRNQSAAVSPPAGAADGAKIYRLQRDQHGEAKPFLVDADEAATWTEKLGSTEYCVFLFRGRVFAQQGLVQARFEQGVAWIDVTRYRQTGKLHTQLYIEGKVRIDDGSAINDYPRALLDLTTRGEFKMGVHRVPLVRQSRAGDPLVGRGRAEGLGPRFLQAAQPAANAPTVQPASFRREEQLILPPTVLPASKSPPKWSPNLQPPPPLPPPPSPRGAAPPPGTLQRIANYGPLADPSTSGAAAAGQGEPTATRIPPPAQAGPAPAQPTALPGGGPQPPTPQSPANASPPAPDGSVPPSGPTRVPPGTPPVPPPSRPTPPPPGKPAQVTPNFVVAPRQGGKGVQLKRSVGPNGEAVFVITGGVILQVRNANHMGMIDMEADRIVIWTHSNGEALANNIQQSSGFSSNDLEVYLSGHVILRQAPAINLKREERTITAEEVYYDVNRSVALALNGRLELRQMLLNDPLIATAKEIRQTSINTFEIVNSETFSSRLPSDPGLKIILQDGVIEDRRIPLRNVFGLPVLDRGTGQPVLVQETLLSGNNNFFEMEKIPFFWLPQVTTSLQEPLGPVQNFSFGDNRIFGAQFGVSLNLYQLLGLQPRPRTRWLLNLDYLTARGPGIGTLYNTSSDSLFGLESKYTNTVRAFGMYDRGYDVLGGLRPVNNFQPPNFRGWFLDRIVSTDMPYGFSALSQISPVSDRNFIEQYYKRVWDLDPNFDTFLFIKQQRNSWAWTAEAMPRLRPWVTMTQDLPRLDGWYIGKDLFHFITYTTHVNAEYAILSLSNDTSPLISTPNYLYLLQNNLPIPPSAFYPVPQVSTTDQNNSTFRASWMQEAEVPFYLGPLKLAPYGRLELTGYSNDLAGNSVGRVWGAGGGRASIPFTHLYRNVASEMFNLNGLNHKINFNANYVYATTNVNYLTLPQLDRLNTDAANQALRDIDIYQGILNPTGVFGNHGFPLVLSPYFKPQEFAIRRLLFDRDIDTLSTIEELQLQLSQRLQTKRGFPGNQHIVDWMTLDLFASYFPAAQRDNFGKPWSFLQYNYLWNLGDRTAITSTGWEDPFPGGVRSLMVGGYFNRPDRTNLYLGFQYIDPLRVRAVTLSISYIFSPKYAGTVSSTYDFGTGEAFANSLMFTRMGSDLQVSLGVSYNALQQNFNFLFNIVPNLLPKNKAFGPMGAQGGGASGGVLGSNF